jgi:hypothetical protein
MKVSVAISGDDFEIEVRPLSTLAQQIPLNNLNKSIKEFFYFTFIKPAQRK